MSVTPADLEGWGNSLKATIEKWVEKFQSDLLENKVFVNTEMDRKLEAWGTMMRGEMSNMQAELRELRHRKENNKKILTEKRSFSLLNKFGGKCEEFEDWHFKTVNFLAEEGMDWRMLIADIEVWEKEPSDEDIAELQGKITSRGGDPAYMNNQLYSVLCSNVTGNALTGIKRLEHIVETNGFVAWWKIYFECNAMTGNKIQGIANKIYSPKRAKKYQDVNNLIDEWEINVKLFEDAEVENRLSDQTKIYSLRQIVPEDLERDIIRAGHLKGYKEIRAYITEQVSIRRDMKASSGVVPMDVDYAKQVFATLMDGDDKEQMEKDEKDVEKNEQERCRPCGEGDQANAIAELFSFVKGRMQGKGGGDGGKGGSGKFEGNCSHCGKYGHRQRECWEKDRIMNEWRQSQGKGGSKGQGKGDKGGKGWWDRVTGGGKGGWNGSGGWNNGGWNNKGGNGGYNNAKGYSKGKDGRGKGAYSLEGDGSWGEWGSAQDNGKGPWSLFTLSKAEAQVEPPPGLSSGFEVLSCREAEECEEMTVTDQNFPEVNIADQKGKKRMPPMKNYSKNSVRKVQEEGWRKKESKEGAKPCCLLDKAPITMALNPFVGATPDQEGWVKIKGVMDSGASESVAPPTMCPHYEVRPSPGSIAGQKYLSASEDLIENLGEQELDVVTRAGKESKIKYQIAEVTRPLNAVSEICDAGGEEGQLVVFGKKGGMIYNLATGAETRFDREGGIYCLEFWVKPNKEAGFGRQGR